MKKVYCVYYETLFNGIVERHVAWASTEEEAKRKESYFKNDLNTIKTEII